MSQAAPNLLLPMPLWLFFRSVGVFLRVGWCGADKPGLPPYILAMSMKAHPLLGVVSAFAMAVPAAGKDWKQATTTTKAVAAVGTALVPGAVPFMRITGPSQPPYGFTRLCERLPDAEACVPQRIQDVRFTLTLQRIGQLAEINETINTLIQPATDQEFYGVSEYWEYPVEYGDCEDYALLKQKVLVERGWPKSALLLTVVRDEKGEGHAVLTARTDMGDFVLDNKVDEVKTWSETGYTFIMRQSYLDPRVWVSLEPFVPPALTDPVAGGAPVSDRTVVYRDFVDEFIKANPLAEIVVVPDIGVDLGPEPQGVGVEAYSPQPGMLGR